MDMWIWFQCSLYIYIYIINPSDDFSAIKICCHVTVFFNSFQLAFTIFGFLPPACLKISVVLGLSWIVPTVYVRRPSPISDSVIPLCLLLNAGLQGEPLGSLWIPTQQIFSKLGIPWRLEGRSNKKSPFSSVVLWNWLDCLVFRPGWQETATDAPAIRDDTKLKSGSENEMVAWAS